MAPSHCTLQFKTFQTSLNSRLQCSLLYIFSLLKSYPPASTRFCWQGPVRFLGGLFRPREGGWLGVSRRVSRLKRGEITELLRKAGDGNCQRVVTVVGRLSLPTLATLTPN